MNRLKVRRPGVVLFLVGFLGIMSISPLIPKLLALQSEPLPLDDETIQLISFLQSSVLLIAMVWVGSIFSKKVKLSSPLIDSFVRKDELSNIVKAQIYPALIGGVLGGLFILAFFAVMSSHLPNDFLFASKNLELSWYAKILYGGITEEVLIRWGVMSFLVWVSYRLTQKKGMDIEAYNYILGIVFSSLIFALAHLPMAFALTVEVTTSLIAFILIGNTSFGLVAGYLFWKYGLECAIFAHIVAHLFMIIGANIL